MRVREVPELGLNEALPGGSSDESARRRDSLAHDRKVDRRAQEVRVDEWGNKGVSRVQGEVPACYTRWARSARGLAKAPEGEYIRAMGEMTASANVIKWPVAGRGTDLEKKLAWFEEQTYEQSVGNS